MIAMALILINFDIPAGVPLAQQVDLLSRQSHVDVLFDYTDQLTRAIGRTSVRGPHTVREAACMLTENTRSVPKFQFLKGGGVSGIAIWSLNVWTHPRSSAPPKWERECVEMLRRPKPVHKAMPAPDEPTWHECVCAQTPEGIRLGPWCWEAKNERHYVPACRAPSSDMLQTAR